MMDYREEIARRYGFDSFAELLDISEPLPKEPGETVQTYIARKPGGHWFLWRDEPPAEDSAQP
jgi:hypothetical protein